MTIAQVQALTPEARAARITAARAIVARIEGRLADAHAELRAAIEADREARR